MPDCTFMRCRHGLQDCLDIIIHCNPDGNGSDRSSRAERNKPVEQDICTQSRVWSGRRAPDGLVIKDCAGIFQTQVACSENSFHKNAR